MTLSVSSAATRFAQRLNERLEKLGFPSGRADRSRAFGQALGVDPSLVSHLLTGQALPELELLLQIAAWTGDAPGYYLDASPATNIPDLMPVIGLKGGPALFHLSLGDRRGFLRDHLVAVTLCESIATGFEPGDKILVETCELNEAVDSQRKCLADIDGSLHFARVKRQGDLYVLADWESEEQLATVPAQGLRDVSKDDVHVRVLGLYVATLRL